MAKMNEASLDEEQRRNEEQDFEFQEWLQTERRKTTIRLPTEQYAYIEIETEATPNQAIELSRYYSELYKGGTGIPEKEFNEYLDNYLSKENPIGSEVYVAMNAEQQKVIQIIKRSIKRIKSKE